jgi:eukaryotic-like serine/threonine-protein kinase
VYRAWDVRRERHVALKRLIGGAFASDGARARLARELEAARALAHPNIVAAHGLEHAGSQPILVMEWIEGRPITRWARAPECGHERVLRAFVKICGALEHAHRRGVVHRDLKPANILIDERDEPHLLDFGLAHVAAGEREAEPLTQSEAFLGTLAYASPEQLRGEPVSARSDLFALGVVLCEAITGRRPFQERAGPVAALRAIERRGPDLRGAGALTPVLRALLAAEPADRYPSAAALERDLERVLCGHRVRGQGSSAAWRSARRLVRRHPLATALAVAAIAALLVLTIVLGVQRERALLAAQRSRAAQAFLTDLLFSASAQREGADITALDLLQQASREAPARLGDHPEVLAAVERRIAETYASLWMWSRAIAPLAAARAASERACGARSTEVALVLDQLALARACNGDPGAVEAAEAAVDILHARLGGGDSRTRRASMHRSFAVARERGECDRAAHELEAAIAELDPAEASLAGEAQHRLGLIELDRGQDDAAERAFAAAVSCYRRTPEQLRSGGIECLNLLALLRQERGDHPGAADALTESLAIMPAAFGESWRPVLTWRLGRVRQLQGEREAARALYREALAIWADLLATRDRAAAPRAHRLAADIRLGTSAVSASMREVLEWIEAGGLATSRHVRGSAAHLAELSLSDGDLPVAIDLARMALDSRSQNTLPSTQREAASVLLACAGLVTGGLP